MENIKCVHFLSGTDELDRFVDYGADRKGGTAARITIQFG